MTGKAAIVGGGVIGAGWAARFLLNGWDVAVADPDPEAPRKIGEVLDGARRALPMLYDRSLPGEGNLTVSDDLEAAVRDADWIQESVPERLEIKHAVRDRIEAAASPDALIASSTSGFKPSELRQGAARPDRILVAHPFQPVYLLPLVELVGDGPNDPACVRAATVLDGIGMYPLTVRGEIDAHIADRLLEAVWREALWLVKDDIATTEEIDEAIRMGFGLRWAQMGLFETYRIGGGEAGMAHFLAQFGPALKWPWTKLMDVPELDEALVAKIAAQSDTQAAGLGLRDLERLRDNNLVAILRALKAEGAAAGRVMAAHDARLSRPLADGPPMVTVSRVVPSDWTDYNGHMNESRYGQVFSDAADAVMVHVGADADYVATGKSYFTVETSVRYLEETHAGEAIFVETRVLVGQGKKLKLGHAMKRASDATVLATCDQFLLHVSLETRSSCPPDPEVEAAVERLAACHAD
ncbi:MAG: carnitine 3-dehydrogenase [Pseudomonadota bacterium]